MAESSRDIKRWIFWSIIVVLALLSIWIVKPFIISIISAFILAFLIKPLHGIFEKNMGKSLAAIMSILVIVITLIVPLAVIIGSTISQADALANTSISGIDERLSSIEGVNLEKAKESALAFLVDLLKKTILSIPLLLISIIIMLLAIFYMLLNWSALGKLLREYLPFQDKARVSNEIATITHHIVYGYLLIALIEFVIGVIGFYFSGVKAFLILPLLIAILAFIPGLGPVAVWAPTAIFYFIRQDYATAIGVLVTGLIISFVVETFLLAKIVGSKSKINPMVFLIGILGGIPIFGIFGFIIGPLVLVYTIKLLNEAMSQ